MKIYFLLLIISVLSNSLNYGMNGGDLNKQLVDAVLKGEDALVIKLIEQGAAINGNIAIYWHTPLGYAVKQCKLSTVQLLLDYGADVNAVNYNGQRPIDYALSNNDMNLVQLLVEKGADININALDKNNLTPLHKAIKADNRVLVELLLAKVVDSSALYTNGKNIMHYAAYVSSVSMLQLLIDKGLDPNTVDKNKYTPLHVAAGSCNNSSLAELLLNKGALIDAFHRGGQAPIHAAAWAGNNAVIELLLSRGVPVDFKDEEEGTPLHLAACNDQPSTIKLLLEKGAAINAVDQNGQTALHCAVTQGNISAVKLLLEKGADTSILDADENSLLDCALGHLDMDEEADENHVIFIAEILLSYISEIPDHLKDEDIIKRAQSNRFKLSQANNLKRIAYLIQKGAYAYPIIKAYIGTQRQKLFDAIRCNDSEAVSELLKEGFTLNTCDKEGNTLLHKALQARSIQVMQLLLHLGADKYLNKTNAYGLTPLGIIVSHNDKELFNALFIKEIQEEQSLGIKRKR